MIPIVLYISTLTQWHDDIRTAEVTIISGWSCSDWRSMDHDGFVMWNSDQTQIQYLWSCQTNPYTHHGYPKWARGAKRIAFSSSASRGSVDGTGGCYESCNWRWIGSLGSWWSADDQLMWRWRNGHGLPMGLRFFDSHWFHDKSWMVWTASGDGNFS